MLVLHKHYNFTHNDVGKIAVLANHERVKIISVIRESGQLHSVYGVKPEFSDLIVWDSRGKSEIPELDIVMLLNDKK